MARFWVAMAALDGLLAVALAAAGAHALAARLQGEAGGLFRTALQIQMFHVPALLAAAWWMARGGRLAVLAACGFLLGSLLFCAAVYSLALGGPSLGLAAPAGGVILMLGWLLLALSALLAR